MNKFKRFLANIKGSAFIENLMVYITVAVIGLIVVGIIGKTINDAAAGSKYQDEIGMNNTGNGSDGSGSENYDPASLALYEQFGIWPGTYGTGFMTITSDGTLNWNNVLTGKISKVTVGYDSKTGEPVMCRIHFIDEQGNAQQLQHAFHGNTTQDVCMLEKGGCN